MANKSWKTTLGGACAAVGVFLFGVPIVLTQAKIDYLPEWVTVTAVIGGLVLQAAGIFFATLFARDNDKTSEQVGAIK